MSQTAAKATTTQPSHVTDGFDSLVLAAVTLSHDPATVNGLLNYWALCPSAQRAWLTSRTAVARGL